MSSKHDVGAILHFLLEKIFKDLDIDNKKFIYYLDNYLRDPNNGVQQTKRDIVSARGNCVKELKKPSISWLTFIRALRIIKATRFKITITIHHVNGVDSDHSLEIDLGSTNAELPKGDKNA